MSKFALNQAILDNSTELKKMMEKSVSRTEELVVIVRGGLCRVTFEYVEHIINEKEEN